MISNVSEDVQQVEFSFTATGTSDRRTVFMLHQLVLDIILFRRRQWHPTPVLLPGKSHGRRCLVGCSPWGRKELDTTEGLHFHFSLSCIGEGNGNPLQCSCLENPRGGGAWWAAIYGVAQSRTQLKWLSSSSSSSSYLEAGNRRWDGWMTSPTRWTWVWASSGSWWWTRKPGSAAVHGVAKMGHEWVKELNWTKQKQTHRHREQDFPGGAV